MVKQNGGGILEIARRLNAGVDGKAKWRRDFENGAAS
jgi:hypothetical protein